MLKQEGSHTCMCKAKMVSGSRQHSSDLKELSGGLLYTTSHAEEIQTHASNYPGEERYVASRGNLDKWGRERRRQVWKGREVTSKSLLLAPDCLHTPLCQKCSGSLGSGSWFCGLFIPFNLSLFLQKLPEIKGWGSASRDRMIPFASVSSGS